MTLANCTIDVATPDGRAAWPQKIYGCQVDSAEAALSGLTRRAELHVANLRRASGGRYPAKATSIVLTVAVIGGETIARTVTL